MYYILYENLMIINFAIYKNLNWDMGQFLHTYMCRKNTWSQTKNSQYQKCDNNLCETEGVVRVSMYVEKFNILETIEIEKFSIASKISHICRIFMHSRNTV